MAPTVRSCAPVRGAGCSDLPVGTLPDPHALVQEALDGLRRFHVHDDDRRVICSGPHATPTRLRSRPGDTGQQHHFFWRTHLCAGARPQCCPRRLQRPSSANRDARPAAAGAARGAPRLWGIDARHESDLHAGGWSRSTRARMRAGKFAGARCPRGGRLPPGARLARPHSRRATSPPPGPSRSRNAPAGASSGRDSTNADAAGAPPATEAASSTAAAEAIIEASSARRPPPVVRLGRSWGDVISTSSRHSATARWTTSTCPRRRQHT